jgi:hypothetical protein
MTACKGFVEEMSGLPRARSYAEFFSGYANLSTANPQSVK